MGGLLLARYMMRLVFLFFVLSLAIATGGSAACAAEGGLNVHPLRIDLNDMQRTGSIVIDNAQGEPELMRVEADAWDQSVGRDRYVRCDDLLIVPPILNVPSKQGKIVRLALRRMVSGAREQSYRVFITEIVPEIKTVKGARIQVAYRIGIPVFVNAGKISADGPADGGAQWKARLLGGKRIRLSVSSQAATHIRITSAKVYADASKSELIADHSLSEYLLAGASRSFDIDVDKRLTLPTLVVEGSGAGGPYSVAVPVSAY